MIAVRTSTEVREFDPWYDRAVRVVERSVELENEGWYS